MKYALILILLAFPALPQKNYIGTSWIAAKTADQSVVSSITLTNDVDLFFSVAPNRKYKFEVFAPFNLAGTTSGYKFGLTAPAGATVTCGSEVVNGVTFVLATARVDLVAPSFSGALASAGNHCLTMRGTVINGATAGNLRLQFAQSTSNASAITIKRGAYMTLTETN